MVKKGGMSRIASAIVVLCLPIASVPIATAHASAYAVSGPAEGDPEAAEEHRQAAIEAFNGGDLPGAIASFEKAYEADPSPAYLFNIGRVYEEMGELENALEYYERFARQPHLTLEERERAGERIDVLRRLVGEQTQDDDGGEEDAGEDDLDDGGDEPPTEPTGPDDTAGPERSGRGLIIAGSTLLGVGAAVALGGGLGFGFVARDRSDQVDAVEQGDNPEGLSLSEIEDLDAEGRTFEIWQIVTVAAGGALAVTGVSLLAVGLVRRGKAKRTAFVQPSVGPRFGGVVVRARF